MAGIPCTSVEFHTSRWYVDIHITDAEGTVQVYRASADAGHTHGDGIAFGPVDTLRPDAAWP